MIANESLEHRKYVNEWMENHRATFQTLLKYELDGTDLLPRYFEGPNVPYVLAPDGNGGYFGDYVIGFGVGHWSGGDPAREQGWCWVRWGRYSDSTGSDYAEARSDNVLDVRDANGLPLDPALWAKIVFATIVHHQKTLKET